MKKWLPILVVIAAALLGYARLVPQNGAPSTAPLPDERRRDVAREDRPAVRVETRAPATSDRQRHGQLEGSGIVVRILADDNDGSRHQRFILRRDSGKTVLVAHNIDVADRIPGLRVGDNVAFFGEFEPNPQGGVVHWTHHDPAGRHVGGWLRHNGRTYE